MLIHDESWLCRFLIYFSLALSLLIGGFGCYSLGFPSDLSPGNSFSMFVESESNAQL